MIDATHTERSAFLSQGDSGPLPPRQVSKLLLGVSRHVIYRDDWQVDDISSLLSCPEIVTLCPMSTIYS